MGTVVKSAGPITALRRSSEQPSFQSLSRFRQSHERPRISLAVPAAQPIVPPPMHALRLLRKCFCYVLTASQAHLNFSRRGNPSFAHRFLLARIGQAAALPTRKNIAGVVNLCDPPSTIPPVGVDRASEPGASATEVAFGPCDWNALPNIFPFDRAVRARTVDEHDSVMLRGVPVVPITEDVTLRWLRPRERCPRATEVGAFASLPVSEGAVISLRLGGFALVAKRPRFGGAKFRSYAPIADGRSQFVCCIDRGVISPG